MKKWYLISDNTSPNMIGGFENEGFNQYKNDAFSEVLTTELSRDVVLYNCDLTNAVNIRCVIQGNSPDTYLKSMERIGLFTPGLVKAGMYIYFENCYWLITGYPSNNGFYEKATMHLCQHKICWQNKKGAIIERWCNVTSASKYDTGETGNSTIVLSSDNLTLLLPNDFESTKLDGLRVFIDIAEIPKKVYKITRSDTVLYNYGEHGGILSFIADKDEFNPSTDNQDIRVCDYFTLQEKDDDDTTNWKMSLFCNCRVIKPLNEYYTIEAKLYDENAIEIIDDIEYVWSIDSSALDYLTYIKDKNILQISLSSKCEMYGEEITVTCMSKHTGHTKTITFKIQEVW